MKLQNVILMHSYIHSYSWKSNIRAAPIPGICIGIGAIPANFDDIGIGQVCYKSTNSVVCALLAMKFF